MHQKPVPDPLFYFGKQPKNSHCMQEILLKTRYFERGLSKTLKKQTLLFLSNAALFNGQSYQKQKEPETTDQPLFRL